MTAENDTSFTPAPAEPGRETAPEGSTAIQAGPPPATETSIPLPPIQTPVEEPITPEELAVEIRRLDWVLSGLVLILGFLLASFALRNSDFFMHLAQGRLYAHGQFKFGTDPFSYTKTAYWSNSSWLYDLLLYGLTTLAGGSESAVAGTILVVLKALLVVLLAWFMLKTSRPGLSKWAPALCTALALVAMSPRLLFQPTLISMLFLAITLYILQSPRHGQANRGAATGKSPLRGYWLLPVLFAFWVNLDAWWFLGPATVALYLLGQVLQQVITPIRTGDDAPEPGQLQVLSLVLVLGVAAGLLNPHHAHAFTLPALISPAVPVDVYQQDRTLRIFFQSALREDYFTGGMGMNAAGLAYFPLLAVGLISFGLALFGEWRWWRFLIWLAFAALSAYRVRMVPFFAVVGGPIAALNFQDFAASNFGVLPRVDRGWRAFSLAGRIFSLLLGVLLILAAWPGWLHGRPTDPTQARRVSWQILPEFSMRAAALKLNDWHAQGLLKPEQNGFNYNPDLANYCAWYCADPDTGAPREKSFFDYRFELFPREVVAQYVGLREALIGGDQGNVLTPVDWPSAFRKQNITHVVASHTDQAFVVVWSLLLLDWKQWPLVALPEGGTAIFRWQDPLKRQDSAPALPRLDLQPLAFGPDAVKPPASGPPQTPQPQDLLARFWYGPPAQSTGEDESKRYMEYFNLVHGMWYRPYLLTSEMAMWTGAVGVAGQSPGAATVASQGQLLLTTAPVKLALGGVPLYLQFCLAGKDFGPPSAPVLAVRAARKGIVESPNNATAYFRLAAAYLALWQQQEEVWASMSPVSPIQPNWQQMRQIQLITALEQGLRLRPTDAQGQKMLAEIYYQIGYYDLALEHFQEVIKRSARDPGEPQDHFKKRLEDDQQGLKGLDDDVRRQKNEFQLESANKPVLQKAYMALRRRLARQAIEVLLGADPLQMNRDEIDLLINLLLKTGAGTLDKGLDDVRDTLKNLDTRLGPNYERYAFLMEAATGNYAEADKYIADSIQKLERETHMALIASLRTQAFASLGAGMLQQANMTLQNIRTIANFKTLQGMLAVEAGNTADAARLFREAIDINNKQPFEFESKAIAVRYLNLIKAAGGAR